MHGPKSRLATSPLECDTAYRFFTSFESTCSKSNQKHAIICSFLFLKHSVQQFNGKNYTVLLFDLVSAGNKENGMSGSWAQLLKAGLALITASQSLTYTFHTPVYFKTSETKTGINSDKISEGIFLNLQTSCSEITFKLYVNLGLR